MTDSVEQVPHDIQQLLRDCIESYEQLETLLLLRREPTIQWSCDAVAQRLNITADAAKAALIHLGHRGLLQAHDGGGGASFRYEPSHGSVDQTVELLGHWYQEKRLPIMAVLNTQAMDRVRSAAARMFADAFLLGGKKNG